MSKNKPGTIVKKAQAAGMDVYDYVASVVNEHGSVKAAARALGVTQPAVRYYLLAPPPQLLTIDDVKEALAAHGSIRGAANALHISPRAIYDRIRRAGLKIRTRVELVKVR